MVDEDAIRTVKAQLRYLCSSASERFSDYERVNLFIKYTHELLALIDAPKTD